MYETLGAVSSIGTEPQNCQLLTGFYKFKFETSKDMLSNFVYLENLSHRLIFKTKWMK